MWKNIVEPALPQTTIRRMRIACWIPKATKTKSEYVKLTAFPLHQWMHKHVSVIRYTNTWPVLLVLCFCCTVQQKQM